MSTIHTLDQSSFRSFARSPGAIVRVTRGEGHGHLPHLIRYFETEYPNAFVFGALDRQRVTIDQWGRKNFGWCGRSGRDDGYYLFIKGKCKVHHTGNDPDSAATVGAAIAALLLKDPKVVVAEAKRSHGRGADAVASSFERHLSIFAADRRILEAAPARPRTPPHPGQRRTRQTRQQSSYQLLGVSPTATDAEVRKAYKRLVSINHPDKLAQMDPELQAFAERRLKDINAAWAVIQTQRGFA